MRIMGVMFVCCSGLSVFWDQSLTLEAQITQTLKFQYGQYMGNSQKQNQIMDNQLLRCVTFVVLINMIFVSITCCIAPTNIIINGHDKAIHNIVKTLLLTQPSTKHICKHIQQQHILKIPFFLGFSHVFLGYTCIFSMYMANHQLPNHHFPCHPI